MITLKQGFGRLIRSLHDRGLLVLLDNRILKKAYGKVFVESLPAYRRTTDIRQVEEFFGVDRIFLTKSGLYKSSFRAYSFA